MAVKTTMFAGMFDGRIFAIRAKPRVVKVNEDGTALLAVPNNAAREDVTDTAFRAIAEHVRGCMAAPCAPCEHLLAAIAEAPMLVGVPSRLTEAPGEPSRKSANA